MVRAGIIVAALLCAGGGLGIRAQDPVSDETIRATVNVVMAPVTVLDRHGDYVSGLQPQAFRLLDNGKDQKIQVDVAFQPISLVIAVQANDHVEGLLPKINKIGSLIQPLVIGEQGEAAVMAFDHRFRIMQDFTSDSTKIESAIKKITPRLTVNGQTYYWLLVKDKAGYAFSIVVWGHQWDNLGPFEEGEERELTVKVPSGDYAGWSLN